MQPKVTSLTKATRERLRKARAMKKGPARSATVRGSVSGSEPSLKNFSSSDLILKHGVFRSDVELLGCQTHLAAVAIAFLWKSDFLIQKSKKPVILASRIPLFNVSMNIPLG